jgi:hypothetical protein
MPIARLWNSRLTLPTLGILEKQSIQFYLSAWRAKAPLLTSVELASGTVPSYSNSFTQQLSLKLTLTEHVQVKVR